MNDLITNDDDVVSLPHVFYQSWKVALHPDGNLLAIGTHRGPIRWVRGQKPRIPPDLDPALPRPRLRFSPDGDYLAFAPVGGGIELWDGGVTNRLASWHPSGDATILGMGFAGRSALVVTADGRLQVLSLPEMRPGDSLTISHDPRPLSVAAFSPDASRLAIADAANRVRLLDTSGRRLRELPPSPVEVTALAWSHDNRFVALATRMGIVQVWDVAEGSPWYRFSAFNKGADSILFHPDGQWLFAGTSTGTMVLWNVVTGERIRTQVSGPWDISRDGRTLATGREFRVGFCDWITPEVIRTLRGHPAPGGRSPGRATNATW